MSAIFNFFGLRENPFKINPDPRFLYTTQQTQATSADLVYAIQSRKGLILLTGEVGTGKTMLIRRLLDWLTEQNMPTALIFNSHLQPEHLLDFILNDFGVPCASKVKSEKLMALNRWLLERYRAGQIPVLIVDEAQGLEPAALEEVRLLLNFETPREKLLQIVLAGQPELETKLKRHELRQLRQRITVRCRTSPLTLEQTYGYVQQRLRVAGANGTPIFEPDAIGSVHTYSRGIPRVINVLCEHSLLNACADSANSVSSTAVEQAARDCQLDRADSIARILSTRSCSTAGLSDINSLLTAVAAASEPPAQPATEPQFSEVFSAAPQDSHREVHPSRAAARVHLPEQPAVPNQIPLASPPARSRAQAPPPQTLVQAEVIPARAPLRQGALPQTRPSPLNFLSLWGRSFARDVRATFRQVRRAIHSFEVRRWKPFAHHLRRELRQLRFHVSRISSHPRWKQLRTRPISQSQASWRRPIVSLRRWLHEPLASQRKRTDGDQHRSMS
jgi:type II secretory pathway predicted ATPase ExeA